MSIEESTLLVETNGEVSRPTRYLYIQASVNKETGELGYELKVDGNISDMLNSIYIIWELLKTEAESLSEQDLYELCEDFNLDYDTFRQQMRGE